MARPKGSKNKNKTVETEKQICVKCNKEKTAKSNFYNTESSMYNGKYPVCKLCISDSLPDAPIDSKKYIEAIKNLLLEMNKPFLSYLWKSSIEEADRRGWTDYFGCYMKNISLPQNRNLTWKDSNFDDDDIKKESQTEYYETDELDSIDLFFKITKDMVVRWGSNYNKEEYMKLEDFYHKMKDMNRIETPQDETYLKKLAVISLKMDQELENGNYSQVKSLGDLFSKYMADSKFRAMDKSEADKTGGIRNFGTIFAEVEKDGHIPPWEEFRKIKGLKQDIIDQTILHIENFTLRLNKIERMTEPPPDTPKVTEDGDTSDEL